ncbi:hypothetical protein HYC85_019568 [Camellia sinensis]|uniref:Pentacotripeptide-repeat region of PRORP domain-containing protein n=1 Tax=Camellia sinensis TaxID=4442 RepID=A0A7J7GQZ3_CAMSI|nr:hypothetical protein HYC85_019568 [Camellia sinensis]
MYARAGEVPLERRNRASSTFCRHGSHSSGEVYARAGSYVDRQSARAAEFTLELELKATSTFADLMDKGGYAGGTQGGYIPLADHSLGADHGCHVLGKGRFGDALYYLKKMEEINLKPDTETYNGLIRAYWKYRMYDEMDQCLKKMEADGCSLDHITYNLLIQEFSRAGLLTRTEKLYQILISKRMDLQSSTLVAMLEAYANLGILDKMEKFYRRVLNSKTLLRMI